MDVTMISCVVLFPEDQFMGFLGQLVLQIRRYQDRRVLDRV